MGEGIESVQTLDDDMRWEWLWQVVVTGGNDRISNGFDIYDLFMILKFFNMSQENISFHTNL